MIYFHRMGGNQHGVCAFDRQVFDKKVISSDVNWLCSQKQGDIVLTPYRLMVRAPTGTDIRLVLVLKIEYFTCKQKPRRQNCSILDQGQVIKYFSRISLVMNPVYYNFYRISLVMSPVYYNYSNAGPECHFRTDTCVVCIIATHFCQVRLQWVRHCCYKDISVYVRVWVCVCVCVLICPDRNFYNWRWISK